MRGGWLWCGGLGGFVENLDGYFVGFAFDGDE
jgi:hypothetical protein